MNNSTSVLQSTVLPQPVRKAGRNLIVQRFKKLICMVSLAAAGGSLCHGQVVSNGSFESGPSSPPVGGVYIPAPDSTTIPGWTVVSGSVDYVGNNTWQAENGNISLDMCGHNAGTIMQNVSGFTVGNQYRLSFYMAANVFDPPTIKNLNASVGSTSHTFTFDGTGHSYSSMGWTLDTLNFTATSSTMAVEFADLDNSDAGATLDNVSITPAPEPGAISLLCAAAALFAVQARRKYSHPRRT